MGDNWQVAIRRAHLEGEEAVMLAMLGDDLAKREKYRVHHGLDAIHYYLMRKFNWPLAQVRALSTEDLHFLLAEEWPDWKVPERFRDLFPDPRAVPPCATKSARRAKRSSPG
jgi:hypothetical protein